MRDLSNLRARIATDELVLGKLVVECHGLLQINAADLSDDTDKDKLKNFLSGIDVERLRSVVYEYDDGSNYGAYKEKIQILEIVNSNRKKYLELIRLFFKIFEGGL
jgi:hypothetical protein